MVANTSISMTCGYVYESGGGVKRGSDVLHVLHGCTHQHLSTLHCQACGHCSRQSVMCLLCLWAQAPEWMHWMDGLHNTADASEVLLVFLSCL
jgi:hypothetical protein